MIAEIRHRLYCVYRLVRAVQLEYKYIVHSVFLLFYSVLIQAHCTLCISTFLLGFIKRVFKAGSLQFTFVGLCLVAFLLMVVLCSTTNIE